MTMIIYLLFFEGVEVGGGTHFGFKKEKIPERHSVLGQAEIFLGVILRLKFVI